MSSGKAMQATQSGICILKLQGHVTHPLGMALDHFITSLWEREDLVDVVVDLTDTTYLDSTILGLLARIANMATERWQQKVTIISCNADVNLLLSSIGFGDVFILVESSDISVDQLNEIMPLDADEKARSLCVLNAHRELVELNEENRLEFQNVVDMLERDLAGP